MLLLPVRPRWPELLPHSLMLHSFILYCVEVPYLLHTAHSTFSPSYFYFLTSEVNLASSLEPIRDYLRTFNPLFYFRFTLFIRTSLVPAECPLGHPFKMAPKPKSTAPRMPKQEKNISTPNKTRTRLLDIPTELREQVYDAVLHENPSSLYNLALTSRQISREAIPYLFKQSLVFDGQSELHEWLKTVRPSYLHYVTTIQFKLHDIDPEKIVGALGQRLRRTGLSGPSEPLSDPYKQACDQELGHLYEAFRMLPKVTHFTILPITRADPRPPYRMLYHFFEMLVRSFPNLISLTNYEDSLPMGFVTPLHKLRRLNFPGIAPDPPEVLTKALCELPSLVDLEVYRPDPTRADRGRHAPYSVVRERCDVAGIVRGVFRLESFAFSELRSEHHQSENNTQEIIDAIIDSISALERHKPWLQSLKLLMDFQLEPWIQKKIATFVQSSRLTHLETFDKDLPQFGYLPATIETIALRSSLLRKPFHSWLEKLVAMTQHHNDELPNLTEIVVFANDAVDLLEAKHKSWASRELRKLGIHFWWRRSEG